AGHGGRGPGGLGVGQRAGRAGARRRGPERHDRRQQRAAAAAVPAAPARDEPDTAVVGRHALDELARVAIRTLVKHEASLEQDVFPVGHETVSDVEAEALQLPLAVGPVLADLDAYLQMHASAEEL